MSIITQKNGVKIDFPNAKDAVTRVNFDIPSGETLNNYPLFQQGNPSGPGVSANLVVVAEEGIVGSVLTFTSEHVDPHHFGRLDVTLTEIPYANNAWGYNRLDKLFVTIPGPFKGWIVLGVYWPES